MDDFFATNGGINDDGGSSALTMSENQPEMAGFSSGDVYVAAGSSSIHEERHNGFAVVSPMPPARNVANTVGSSAMDRTLTMETGMFSTAERATYEDMSMEEIQHELITRLTGHPASPRGVQAPFEDIPAAGDRNGSTAASGSGSGVESALPNGASRQVGAMDDGSTTSLPVLSLGEGWSLDDRIVQNFMMLDSMGGGSSNAMTGTIDPRVLMGGAESSANMTAVATPADPLTGAAQSAEDMDAGSSINNNSMVAPAATLDGYGPPQMQMSASSSVNNFVADNATFGGPVQQPQQMSAGNSANYPVATQATPNGFYVQPQMPMVAGNSTTNNNFAAQQLSVASPTYNNIQSVQQQLNFASNGYSQQQMAPISSVQPFNPQLNTAPQAYGYHAAAQAAPQAAPPNGTGQYFQAPMWPVGYDAVSAMAYQQLGGLNGGAHPNMGQNSQAPSNGLAQPYMGLNVPMVAPQVAAPVAVARTRHRQGDASGPAKRRRTDPAPAGPAPTSAVAAQAPAQQQVAAQQEEEKKEEGPYTHTAAGAPNLDSTKKGNRQGQVPYWGQAFRHHNSRCDKLTLNGCVPDCQVRAKWPETWTDWNSRRFRVQWKTAQNGRPQIEDLSGFAVHSEGKGCMARFVVLGEIQADGSVGKAKPLHRVEVAAVLGPQSG